MLSKRVLLFLKFGFSPTGLLGICFGAEPTLAFTFTNDGLVVIFLPWNMINFLARARNITLYHATCFRQGSFCFCSGNKTTRPPQPFVICLSKFCCLVKNILILYVRRVG